VAEKERDPALDERVLAAEEWVRIGAGNPARVTVREEKWVLASEERGRTRAENLRQVTPAESVRRQTAAQKERDPALEEWVLASEERGQIGAENLARVTVSEGGWAPGYPEWVLAPE
jgi:hypothetical protein